MCVIFKIELTSSIAYIWKFVNSERNYVRRKRGNKMAKIVVSYKIFPSDINVDFGKLKQTIEKNLPADVEVYGYGIEPIAFGLNALIAHLILPEDKSGILENLEENLKNIPEISQIQTVMVRRTH